MNTSALFTPGPTTLSWVGAVLVHPSPLKPRDPVAAAHLYDLVAREALALSKLSTTIAAVGASPNKFNDASDAAWEFARVDRAVFNDDGYLSAQARPSSPTQLSAALAALDRLEAGGWRQWWTRAFGEWFYDQFLALVVQDGAPWLLYCTSNAGDRDHAFSLWQEDRLVYFGETFGRMDERLPDEPAPLQFIPSDVAFEDRWLF